MAHVHGELKHEWCSVLKWHSRDNIELIHTCQ